MDIYSYFGIGLLVIIGVFIALLLKFIIEEVLTHVVMFLNSLATKSLQAQKYYHINNLIKMKKYIGISVLLIVIVCLAAGIIVINDSRDYFKDLFEQQRTELNLRSEASVDSLQFVITKQQKFIDSLNIVQTSERERIVEKINLLETKTNDLQKQNNNLNNVIKHQNQMITNLKNQ